MNLRNKKTGYTGFYLHTHRDYKTGALKIAVLKDGVSFSEFKPYEPIYDYDSLAELNEEWEDCEPLKTTKDQDIINLLRSENAYLRGKIEAYEKFLKDKGYIKDESRR